MRKKIDWNNKSFEIDAFIPDTLDKTEKLRRSEKYSWMYKCVNDGRTVTSKDKHDSAEDAVGGAISHIMSNE